MLRLRLRRPRHATIVAYLALFIALGGGSYALVRAPARNGTISACFNAQTGGGFRLVNAGTRCRRGERKLTWNQRGLRGLRGFRGFSGQTGAQGTPGTPFDANATLPSGQTLTGIWAVGGANSQNLAAPIQFSPQLPAGLPATSVHRIPNGGSSPECAGPGQAARGHLCVYERGIAAVTFNTISDSATGNNGTNRRGATIFYIGAATGNPFADGSWAVTAP